MFQMVHSESQSILFQLDLTTSGSIVVPQASLLICGWIHLHGTQQWISGDDILQYLLRLNPSRECRERKR